MTKRNACTYQDSADQVTDVHDHPVFQHLAYSDLLLQKRDRQQTISGE